MKYNTDTYQHRLCLAETLWLCDAEPERYRCRWWLSIQTGLLEIPRRVDVHKSELAPDYSLLLLTALMHLMRTFMEVLLCLSHEAQKHVRFVIVP